MANNAWMSLRFMKTIVLLLLLSATVYGAGQQSVISDSQILKDGLDIFDESASGARQFTCDEAVKAATAATYTQAFGSACVVWQEKFPGQAPFHLPLPMKPIQFLYVVHQYMKDHPEKLSEKPELLMFDAVVAVFPRK
jgi:hypothetical protein